MRKDAGRGPISWREHSQQSRNLAANKMNSGLSFQESEPALSAALEWFILSVTSSWLSGQRHIGCAGPRHTSFPVPTVMRFRSNPIVKLWPGRTFQEGLCSPALKAKEVLAWCPGKQNVRHDHPWGSTVLIRHICSTQPLQPLLGTCSLQASFWIWVPAFLQKLL